MEKREKEGRGREEENKDEEEKEEDVDSCDDDGGEGEVKYDCVELMDVNVQRHGRAVFPWCSVQSVHGRIVQFIPVSAAS